MILDITPIDKIDWDTPGARRYSVPFTLDGTWGRVRLPLYVANSGKPGKTVVGIGATHGDEYEGPVGLKNLIREFDPASLVSGRLIVIPVFNVPAFKADRRDSPLDGVNMNRAFPGNANGTITSRMARFLTDNVLSRADVLIDIHSGGQGWQIVPCMSFHETPDQATHQRFKKTAMLFGTPFVMIYTSGMGTGLLTEESEKMGITTIGSELGFGASTNLTGVRSAHQGMLNVMREAGLIQGDMVSLTPPGLDRQRVLKALDIDAWVTTPTDGVFEPVATLGAAVHKGDLVGRLHDFDRWDESPVEIRADKDGYVMVRKFRAASKQGDVVMVIGEEVID